jgi:RNA polymerase sigma-70 factor (ECF subfamily)
MTLSPHESAGHSDQFVQLITSSQPRLYAYIMSLVASREQAHDLLQETNMALWRKASEFTPGTDFIAWAFRTASFVVLSHRRDNARNRVIFDEDQLNRVALETEDDLGNFNLREEALIDCLRRLPRRQRELIRLRYTEDRSLKTLQEQLGKPANTLAKALHRIRTALLRCIESRLAEDSQ